MRQEEAKEQQVVRNDTAEHEDFKNLHSLSLLTSKDRDFLLSSTGTQVSLLYVLFCSHEEIICCYT